MRESFRDIKVRGQGDLPNVERESWMKFFVINMKSPTERKVT